MDRAQWNEWMNEYTYDLIRFIRSLRFGEVTVEVHEKNPTKILKALESRKLGRQQRHGRDIEELPSASADE